MKKIVETRLLNPHLIFRESIRHPFDPSVFLGYINDTVVEYKSEASCIYFTLLGDVSDESAEGVRRIVDLMLTASFRDTAFRYAIGMEDSRHFYAHFTYSEEMCDE